MGGRYLKNRETGTVWHYTEGLASHRDVFEISEAEFIATLNNMKRKGKPISVGVPAVLPADPELVGQKLTKEDRVHKIEDAIASIPDDQWGKGFVPLPKVPDVSAITGFPVSFQEIKAITENMKSSTEHLRIQDESVGSVDNVAKPAEG